MTSPRVNGPGAGLPLGALARPAAHEPVTEVTRAVSGASGSDARIEGLRDVGAPPQRTGRLFAHRELPPAKTGAIADPAEHAGSVRGTILLIPYDTGINGDRRPSKEWAKRNTSILVAEALKGEVLDGFRITVAGLPSKYQHQPQRIAGLIADRDADAVIAMGYLGRGNQIQFESFAYNVLDNDTPDLLGYLGQGRPIIGDAPERYRTTLPIRSMQQRAYEALGDNVLADPVAISTDAGEVGCNLAFFSVMDAVTHRAAERNEPPIPAGFIHVPRAPQQLMRHEDPSAFMPFDDIVRGVRASICAVASTLTKEAAD